MCGVEEYPNGNAPEIVDTPHSHAAAAQAVELAGRGNVQALMKGALHTDEVMGAVVSAESGLRTERRMSHVFVKDAPHYPKLLLITDAAINIYPSLEDKRDIVQNAIDLALALGIKAPSVAILSAVETVYPKIKSTVEAAALCKMADRGQITGGVLDGPLAFDNAISAQAARTKHIVSPVAGNADILIVPDLESGNMVARQLIYLAGADAAGVVLGAGVPIMLTSRADGTLGRLASCAVANLFAHHKAKTKPMTDSILVLNAGSSSRAETGWMERWNQISASWNCHSPTLSSAPSAPRPGASERPTTSRQVGRPFGQALTNSK